MAIFKEILVIILGTILKNGGRFFLKKRSAILKFLVQNLGSGPDVKRHKIHLLHGQIQ